MRKPFNFRAVAWIVVAWNAFLTLQVHTEPIILIMSGANSAVWVFFNNNENAPLSSENIDETRKKFWRSASIISQCSHVRLKNLRVWESERVYSFKYSDDWPRTRRFLRQNLPCRGTVNPTLKQDKMNRTYGPAPPDEDEKKYLNKYMVLLRAAQKFNGLSFRNALTPVRNSENVLQNEWIVEFLHSPGTLVGTRSDEN